MFRDCLEKNVTNVCTTKLLEGQDIRSCYETCETDGCNDGPMNTAPRPGVPTSVAVVLSACFVHFVCGRS